MGRLRRRATIARKGIAQILETAAEYGFAGRGMGEAGPRYAAASPRRCRTVERPEEMALGVESLERRQRAARERLEACCPQSRQGLPKQWIPTPWGRKTGPTNIPTNQVLILNRIR